MPRDIAYVALGSNLGDRDAHLARARKALAAIPQSRVIAESSIEETAPLGPVDQDKYLNQMVALETELSPRELLCQLQRIEQAAGRTREVRWAPRTLDLEIVRYETQPAADRVLVVPHPAARARGFWRREMAQLRAMLGR